MQGDQPPLKPRRVEVKHGEIFFKETLEGPEGVSFSHQSNLSGLSFRLFILLLFRILLVLFGILFLSLFLILLSPLVSHCLSPFPVDPPYSLLRAPMFWRFHFAQ